MIFDTRFSQLPELGSEHGFTLIELLVAMSLALVIFGAMGTVLVSSQHLQARDAEWALTMQQGRSGLTRIAREIRQASKVEEAKGNLIVFRATLNGKEWKLKYECSVTQPGTSYTECVRFATEGTTLPSTGTSVMNDITNGASVFTYSPSSTAPTVVTLKAELPASGTLKQANSKSYRNTIVLENSVFMRNLYPAG